MMRLPFAALVAWLLLAPSVCGQVRVPNRANKPLFEGRQGKQNTEIYFDPASGVVTLKLLVQDPNGYFIPNIRRENFERYVDSHPGNPRVFVGNGQLCDGNCRHYRLLGKESEREASLPRSRLHVIARP